jgi:RimJ/RimL family protein N-acetyltransferase
VIVRDAPPQHFMYLVERAGVTPSPLFRAIEVIDERGVVHGMVGYDAWTPNAVVMHIAIDRPVSFRHLVEPAFRYPFEQLGLGIALCAVRSDNVKSVKLTEHVGFKRVYTVKNCFGGGVDQFLYEMRREDCRWLKRKAA